MQKIRSLRYGTQLIVMLLCGLLFSNTSAEGITKTQARNSLKNIKTVVVIYAENRSFDNLYGLFPGAEGVLYKADGSLQPKERFLQLDRDGKTPLPSLPSVWNSHDIDKNSILHAIKKLPPLPFRIDAQPATFSNNLTPDKATPDLVHRFYNNQMQINGGSNNMFAAWSNAGGLSMGYYDGSSMQLWKLAQQYTLADNFFMAAYGGSFLNHFWLIAAATPLYPNAPEKLKSVVSSDGVSLVTAPTSPMSALHGKPVYVADRQLTPDGYAVNTIQPLYQPSGVPPAANGNPQLADTNNSTNYPLPPQNFTTIGDLLSNKGIRWAWYAGGWNEALTDRSIIYNHNSANFQPHHQPFNYFKRFDPTTAEGARQRRLHLKDYSDLQKDIANGTLPSVVFYKPQGNLNQHPGYADVMSGDAHLAEVIRQLQQSPLWNNMAIIVTYDENGGFWDHVAPPKGDRWGPGNRIPAIIISPYAKKGYVDHTMYDTTSILKFLSRRFNVPLLPGVRANVGDLTNAFMLEGK